MNTVYVVEMQKNGDSESHHYLDGVYTDLAVAAVEGLQHEIDRAGKYEMKITMLIVDSQFGMQRHIPNNVALDMAVLKFPDKFNDKKQLKQE